MPRKLPVILLTLSLTPAGAAEPDSVTGMCLYYGKPDQVCACATQGLAEAVSSADYATYESVGADFLVQLGNGLATSDAWDAGVAAYSAASGLGNTDILQITNPVGKAHNQAIKACS